MFIDPVCCTELDGFEYPEQELYNERLYFFHSLECAQKFREDPARYVAGHEEEYGEEVPRPGHASAA